MILPFLTAAAMLLGYWISKLVPEELRIGERWFLFATIVFCIPLFFYLRWWQAALMAGAIIIGCYPSFVGIGLLMTKEIYPVVLLTITLALLVGTRWRVEKRPFLTLLIADLLITALVIVTKLI